MPCCLSSAAGPIPDNCSSCGELIAPPQRMTSTAALAVFTSPPWRYSIPTARLPSNSTRVVKASVSTRRFGRSITGCRYATAAEQRCPFFTVSW